MSFYDEYDHGRYVLDEHGEPRLENDLHVWAEWLETADRSVELTIVGERLRVSTVFLGLDHNHARYGSPVPLPPVLWETMIFTGEGAPTLDYCERYASREDAVQGHRRAVNVATRALQEFEAKVAAWEKAKAEGKFEGKIAKLPKL